MPIENANTGTQSNNYPFLSENTETQGLNTARLTQIINDYIEINADYSGTLDQIDATANDQLLKWSAINGAFGSVPIAAQIMNGLTYFKSSSIIEQQMADKNFAGAQHQAALNKLLNQVNRMAEWDFQQNKILDAEHAELGNIAQSQFASLSKFIDFLDNDFIAPEYKMSLASKTLQTVANQANLLLSNQKKIAATLLELKSSDADQYNQLFDLNVAVQGIGVDLDSLFTTTKSLIAQISQNTFDITGLSKGLSQVQSNLAQVENTLVQHESRLNNLEGLTSLVFRKLTEINTQGLERFDQNIATLYASYTQLRNTKNPDNNAIARASAALSTAIQTKQIEMSNIQNNLSIVFGMADFLSTVGQAIGSRNLQIAGSLVKGITQVGLGIAAMSGLGGSALSALMGSAVLGPVGMIATGVMAIFSSFMGAKKNDGLAKALQQISKQIQDLSRQIQDLGVHIEMRFDNLEDLLQGQQRLILSNFKDTVRLLDEFHQSMMDEFMKLNVRLDNFDDVTTKMLNSLNDLATSLNSGFLAVYGQQIENIRTQIINYYDVHPYGSVPGLNPTEVNQAVLTLVNLAISGAKQPLMGGDSAGRFDPTVLANIEPEQILNNINLLLGVARNGYSVKLTSKALPQNLTAPFDQTCTSSPSNSGDNGRVVNPLVWLQASTDYIDLIRKIPEYKVSSADRCLLNNMIKSGQEFLSMILGLKTNPDLFRKLVDDYQTKWFNFVEGTYRYIVETNKATHAEFSRKFADAKDALTNVFTAISKVKTPALDRNTNLQQGFKVVLDSCWLVYDVYSSKLYLQDKVGNGYCLKDYTGNEPELKQFFDNRVNFPQGPIALSPRKLPLDNCHSPEDMSAFEKVVNASAQVSQSFTNNTIATSADAALNLGNVAATIFDPVLNQTVPNIYQQGIYGQARKLLRLDRWQFTNLMTLKPEDFDNFYAIYKAVKVCAEYYLARYRTGFYVVDYNFQITDQGQLLQKLENFVDKSYMSQISFKSALADLNDALLTLDKLLPTLNSSLTLSEDLRTELLYETSIEYTLAPAQKTKAIISVLQNYLVKALPAERANTKVLLSNAFKSGSLKALAEDLNLSYRALQLYLELAFHKEYLRDSSVQTTLSLLPTGNNLVEAIKMYNYNNATEQLFGSFPEQLHPKVDGKSYNLISDFGNYLTATINRGIAAQNANDLFPGYEFIVDAIVKMTWLRDKVMPHGLSPVDLSAAMIVKAYQNNDTRVIEVVQTPTLNLVNVVRDLPDDVNAILIAGRQCDITTLGQLLEEGGDFNSKDMRGNTLLNQLAVNCLPAKLQNALVFALNNGAVSCLPTYELRDALIKLQNTQPQLVARAECLSLPPTTESPPKTKDPSLTETTSSHAGYNVVHIILAVAGAVIAVAGVAAGIFFLNRYLNNRRAMRAADLHYDGPEMGEQVGQVYNNPAYDQGRIGAAGAAAVLVLGNQVPDVKASAVPPMESVNLVSDMQLAQRVSSSHDQSASTNKTHKIPMTYANVNAHGSAENMWARVHHATNGDRITVFSWHSNSSAVADREVMNEQLTMDSYHHKNCRPISWQNRDGVTCEGESSTFIYQPGSAHQHLTNYLIEKHQKDPNIARLVMHPFNNFDGNLMLGRVAWHSVKQLQSAFSGWFKSWWEPTTAYSATENNLSLEEISQALKSCEDSFYFCQIQLEKAQRQYPQHLFTDVEFILDELRIDLEELFLKTSTVTSADLLYLEEGFGEFETELKERVAEIKQQILLTNVTGFLQKALIPRPMPGDGHCLFHALGHHLNYPAQKLRQLTADYLEKNWQEYENWIPMEDRSNYIADLRTEKWGEQIDINVIQNMTQRPIIVITPTEQILPSNLQQFRGEPIFIKFTPGLGQDAGHYDTYAIASGYSSYSVAQALERHLSGTRPLQSYQAANTPINFVAPIRTTGFFNNLAVGYVQMPFDIVNQQNNQQRRVM